MSEATGEHSEEQATSTEDALRIEEERVGTMLLTPRLYMIRRVEELEIQGTRRFLWHVTQEMDIPRLEEAGHPTRRIVSLGLYSKERLPDLKARDRSGSLLPVLGRSQRGELLANLFLAGYVSDAPGSPVFQSPNAFDRLDRRAATTLYELVLSIIVLPEEVATALYDLTVQWMGKAASTTALRDAEGFRAGLKTLARLTHVLAWIEAVPGDRVVVTHTFSERHDAVRFRDDFTVGDQGGVPDTGVWARGVLRWLGLLPVAMRRHQPNAAHVESYHVTVTGPPGLTVEDAYWESAALVPDPLFRRFEAEDPGAARRVDEAARRSLGQYLRGPRVTLSPHVDDIEVGGARNMWFGLQAAPSDVLLAGMAMTLLLVFVLARVAVTSESLANSTSTDEVALALLLAVPALAAGALAQYRAPTAAAVTQGLRAVLPRRHRVPVVARRVDRLRARQRGADSHRGRGRCRVQYLRVPASRAAALGTSTTEEPVRGDRERPGVAPGGLVLTSVSLRSRLPADGRWPWHGRRCLPRRVGPVGDSLAPFSGTGGRGRRPVARRALRDRARAPDRAPATRRRRARRRACRTR